MVVLTGGVLSTVATAIADLGKHNSEFSGIMDESYDICIIAGSITGAVLGIPILLADRTAATGTTVAKPTAYGRYDAIFGACGGLASCAGLAICVGNMACPFFGSYDHLTHGWVSAAPFWMRASFKGSFSGPASAAAVSSLSVGAVGIVSSVKNNDKLEFLRSIGWCVLGTEENPSNRETQSLGVYTYDCWKAVLHDDSPDPSSGKLLRDVICDPRIKQVTVTVNIDSDFPRLVLDNVWNEKFLIEYLYLNNTELAAHAVKI